MVFFSNKLPAFYTKSSLIQNKCGCITKLNLKIGSDMSDLLI